MVLKVLHAYLYIELKGTWTFLTAKGTLYVLVLFELEGKLLKVQNVLLLEHSSQRDCTFSKSTFFHSTPVCRHELLVQSQAVDIFSQLQARMVVFGDTFGNVALNWPIKLLMSRTYSMVN